MKSEMTLPHLRASRQWTTWRECGCNFGTSRRKEKRHHAWLSKKTNTLRQKWPESNFQTSTPLLFQNFWIWIRWQAKFLTSAKFLT